MAEMRQTGEARIAGLILAGGAGSRMGGVLKANLRPGRERLLDRVRPIFAACAPLLLSIGSHDGSAFAPLNDLIPLPDLDTPYGGPLAGLAASIAWLKAHGDKAEHVLTAAVDSPDLPPNLKDALHQALGEAPGVLTQFEEQIYPTNGLWRVDALADLPSRVIKGTAPRSLKQLAEEMGVGTLRWTAEMGANPFANLNTPEDVAAWRQRHPEGK